MSTERVHFDDRAMTRERILDDWLARARRGRRAKARILPADEDDVPTSRNGHVCGVHLRSAKRWHHEFELLEERS